MSEDELKIPQNDKDFILTFTVLKADGTPFNLTDYIATFIVWPPGRVGKTSVMGSCSIKDAVNGVCEYLVKEGDFAKVSVSDFEIELSKLGSIESTKNYRLQVTESPKAV